ncbi:MAG: hypothetical protein [Cressdnaviricota sp.]|nr:MAG: hypothetical protein [Cressdnaviricota sp.]
MGGTLILLYTACTNVPTEIFLSFFIVYKQLRAGGQYYPPARPRTNMSHRQALAKTDYYKAVKSVLTPCIGYQPERIFEVDLPYLGDLVRIAEDRSPSKDEAYSRYILKTRCAIEKKTVLNTGWHLTPKEGGLLVSACVVGCLPSNQIYVSQLLAQTRDLLPQMSLSGTHGPLVLIRRLSVICAAAQRYVQPRDAIIGKAMSSLLRPWICQVLKKHSSAVMHILNHEGVHNSRRLITARSQNLGYLTTMEISFISRSVSQPEMGSVVDQVRIRIMQQCSKCQLTKNRLKNCGSLSLPITYGFIPA